MNFLPILTRLNSNHPVIQVVKQLNLAMNIHLKIKYDKRITTGQQLFTSEFQELLKQIDEKKKCDIIKIELQ